MQRLMIDGEILNEKSPASVIAFLDLLESNRPAPPDLAVFTGSGPLRD